MSTSHKIDQAKDSCKLGIIPITAVTRWFQDTDTEYHFDVNYKANVFPFPIQGKKTIPVSGNTKGKQELLPGVEVEYEVTDWKISENHAWCHGKVTVKFGLLSCVLVDRDFDGPLAPVSHARFQAAIDKAESEA